MSDYNAYDPHRNKEKNSNWLALLSFFVILGGVFFNSDYGKILIKSDPTKIFNAEPKFKVGDCLRPYANYDKEELEEWEKDRSAFQGDIIGKILAIGRKKYHIIFVFLGYGFEQGGNVIEDRDINGASRYFGKADCITGEPIK